MSCEVEVIAVWDGKNLSEIIRVIVSKNTEITIKTLGPKRKLVIKDLDAGFYRCVPIGEMVEIPKYKEPKIFIDEFEEAQNEATKS